MDKVDLTNCDREPIHIPGSIQPHGVLLALLEPDLTIIQLSDNTLNHFGIEAQALLDQDLDVLLETDKIEYLKNVLATHNLEQSPLYLFTTTLKGSTALYDGVAHRLNGQLVLELERISTDNIRSDGVATAPGIDLFGQLSAAFLRFAKADTLPQFSQLVAQEVQKLTGFDRVMVYQFDPDGHGTVIAEAKNEELTPFLGLHYPASDIPRQARALYILNWLRLIPDATYTPIEIVPLDNPLTGQPLDQSYSVLRSVSPIHLQYLKNMGVHASMSISLVKDNELWGLIACHHQTPRFIPYQTRAACEFLAQMVSLQLSGKAESEDSEYANELKASLPRLIEYMASSPDFRNGLFSFKPSLKDFIRAGGVSFYNSYQRAGFNLGATPSTQQIAELVEWLTRYHPQDIYFTDKLPLLFPAAEAFKEVGCGVLALAISQNPAQYILWFRPEVIQTVNWAGNPNKPVQVSETGETTLTPRASFALWQEQLALHSERWKAIEIEAAGDLRRAILSIILRRLDELSRLQIELERHEAELTTLAQVEESELKAPLHELQNYLAELFERLDVSAREEPSSPSNPTTDASGTGATSGSPVKLPNFNSEALSWQRLITRMESLLDSLLEYSRLGLVELKMEDTDLNQLGETVVQKYSQRQALSAETADIKIVTQLPVMRCDPKLVAELFNIIINNGLQYNAAPIKQIEIGYTEKAPAANTPAGSNQQGGKGQFWVRDNGIGMEQADQTQIFKLFKRLPSSSQWNDAGSGTGLTLAKKIVGLHGGQIWLESAAGKGTTFYFTL